MDIVNKLKLLRRLERVKRKLLTPFNLRPVSQGEAFNEEEVLKDVLFEVNKPVPSESELKMVEIVILKYKDPEVEKEAVKKIIENTDWPFKLNLYDNRYGTKNMSKIWNKIIKDSNCDFLLFMDSDVFVPKLKPCWLTRLMESCQNDDCFVVSPKVTKTSSAFQRANQSEEKSPELIRDAFAGMCVLYKKDVFEKVGLFDESFLLYGSDTEWAHRFVKSGLVGFYRPDVLVEHVGHYSTGKESSRGNKTNYFGLVEKKYASDLLKSKTS